MRLSRETRFRIEHGLAEAVSRAVRWMPRSGTLAFGRFLGRLVGDIDRRHVDIAADNLRRAFPDWDDARLLRTARGVYAHLGQVLLDVIWMQGRSREEILEHVEVEGLENIAAARAGGRGVVFATAHFGSWELNGIAHGWLDRPMGAVARPLDNPSLNARLLRLRQMSGNVVIEKRRGLQHMLTRLRGGEDVAILIDQNVQEQDGVFIEFFSRPAAATKVAAALHVKTGCGLVAGRAEALPDGRYRLRYERPIENEPSGSRLADIVRLTQRLNDSIEAWVRERPEQWLWIHKRWKTQPRSPSEAIGS